MQISKEELKSALHELNSSLHQLEEVLKYLTADPNTERDVLVMQNSSIEKIAKTHANFKKIYLEEESKGAKQ